MRPDGFIAIGEDMDDRTLLMDESAMTIYAELDEWNIYVARSFRAFLEIVLAYATMVDAALKIVGRNAAVNNKIPDNLIHRFLEKCCEVDDRAVSEGSFWALEVARLMSHRED